VVIAAALVVAQASVAAGSAIRASRHALPRSVTLEEALSCPRHVPVGASTCAFAVYTRHGVAIDYLVNGSPKAPNTIANGLQAVDCPTTTTCVFTTQGGLAWITAGKVTASAHVTGVSEPGGVACASASFCVEYGSTGTHGVVALVTKGGPAAAARRVSGSVVIEDVGCATAQRCFAVGKSSNGQHSRGLYLTVTPSSVGSVHHVSGIGLMDYVSCGSSTTCAIAGQHLANYQAYGRVIYLKSGRVTKVVAGSHPPENISCWSATDCMLSALYVGRHGSKTKLIHLHRGRKAGSALIPPLGISLLTCPTSAACIVGGGTGRAYFIARL
jgi:hypothetical protein